MRYLVLAGRVLYSAIFIMGSPGHFTQQYVGYAAQQGVPAARVLVPLSGLIALAGGLSVLLGYRAKVRAWLLVVFLVPVTLAIHNFWAVHDPMAAQIQTELITVARAAENRLYLLTANRVGTERSGEFCGWSQIVDPFGKRLAEAGETEEALLVADIEVEKARDKDYVIPGEYELYLFGDRRPELYRALVEEMQPVKT